MPRNDVFRRQMRALPMILVFLMLLAACGLPHRFSGTPIDPPKPAPDFTLTDQHGQPFTLSDQRGKVVALFFGYTNCPDVCPTTLSDLAAVHRKLGSDWDNVQVAMVTVDPRRDSQEQLQQYIGGFDQSFRGLRGSPEELAPVYKAYGVTAIARDPNNPLVDHSGYVYLIDRDGNWRSVLPFGTTIDEIASDVKYLVRN